MRQDGRPVLRHRAHVEALKRTLSPSEAAFAQECWGVLLMAIEQGVLLTFDMNEVLPPLPFNVRERQGYMIRQTLRI